MNKNKMLKVFFSLLILLIAIQNVFATNEPTTYSYSAIAMDADSGNVLYEKNCKQKVYPASITKILTAILALENLDINKSIVATKTALQIPWDSSSVSIKEDEVLTVKELLYCLLLNSGNDAANVLAEAVSGNISDFVVLMNKKAKELGCTGSNFVNAHGYSNNNHYTTALDIATIFKYCITNEQFINIISTKSYIINPTNKTKTKRLLANTNRLIQTKEDSLYSRFYKYAIGGKTGFTNEAGRTLVTLSRKDNKNVIIAVFKAGNANGKDARYTDAINLSNYAFENFENKTFCKTSDYSFSYINSEAELNYTLAMDNDVTILSNTDNKDTNISYSIKIDEDKLVKIIELDNSNKECICGTIKFDITSGENNYTVTKNLILKNVQHYSVLTKDNIWCITNYILISTLAIFIMILLIFYIKCIKNSKRNNINKRHLISSRKTTRRKCIK